MTWEQIIVDIRQNPEYTELVRDAYLGTDLVDCIERYRSSEEFLEITKYITMYFLNKKMSILDLGAGNGISSIAFALLGHKVFALEPDKSKTVGAGAIKILKDHYHLNNLEIVSCYAEDMPYSENSFDMVFARQAMHHAYNLNSFVMQSARALKPGGFFFTVRDHVVNNEHQKKKFLEQHPLHKFYGGENAFSLREYKNALNLAGLSIIKELGPYDSIINYFPETLETIRVKTEQKFQIPFTIPSILFKLFLQFRKLMTRNYRNQPGRLYSFIAIKK